MFQVLSGFLHKHVYTARAAASVLAADGAVCSPATDFLLSINIRELLARDAGFDPSWYFFSGCYAPCFKFPEHAVKTGTVGDVAALIRSFLKRGFSSDPDRVLDAIRWVAAQQDKSMIRSRFEQSGFMASAWNQFDLYYGAAVDGLRPVLVATPFTEISLIDNLAYYLPLTADLSDRGLLVYMALNCDVWRALEQNPEFCHHIGA